MYTLATLYELRRQMGFDAADTSEDARLLAVLEAASATIEIRTRRSFSPYSATLMHSINLNDATELLLRNDLLELQSVTNGDGSSISLSDVTVLQGGVLRLTNSAAFVYVDTPEEAIAVNAIWGYHPDWDNAWLDSGDTVQDSPLSANATTVTVVDADAGTTPRFQVGQLLQIEAEYLRVVDVNTSTNVLTVERGVQGTTAASHTNGTAISIYQTPQDVVYLCMRWALWLYREPDSPVSELPAALRETLEGLRRISVRS